VTIDEHQRYQLHQALEHQLGPENAATLMAHLPPVGWADVATKHDLHVLRNDLHAVEERLGLRFEAIDHRFEAMDHRITGGLAEVRTEIHKTARAMTITFVGATAAIATAIAALTSLFG
jgi:hypothetical protein